GASKQCDTLINSNKASNPFCLEDKNNQNKFTKFQNNQNIQAQFSITSLKKRKRNAELPYKLFNESGSPPKKWKRRMGTHVKAFNFGPEAHKMYFCSGCVNFLQNFPNDDVYKKISKKISMNASKIVLVWQPFEKERFDSIPNYFIEFGAVKDVREWWAKNGNSYEIGFHVVAYFDEEAANRAVHGLPLVSSNVRVMTLRHLLLAAAEIESSCSDVSNVALQLEKFPQSVKEKEKDLWLVFSKYVPVIDIQRCDQDPTKFQFDVTYKYFTHALAAEISIQVQIKARYKYSVSMRQTSNTQKILKLLKAKLSCHFQENSPSLFAFKDKLMFKNLKMLLASSQDQLMISQYNISCSELNVLQQELGQSETLGHGDLQSRCSKEIKSHLVTARAELLQKIVSKRMEKNRNWQLQLKKCTGNLIKHKLHLSKSVNPKKFKKRKQKKLPFDQVPVQKLETAVQTEPIIKQ
ncbi:uncharacterized protein LOC118199925, partial [Stegodyphus dumicola]|uniref:uncharacterized protein LOC118199925 n=1 Tax=Stegodyphus dumicola TaxID=202533 RepID=UPI0015B0D3F1